MYKLKIETKYSKERCIKGDLFCLCIHCVAPAPPLNVEFTLDNSTAQYNSVNDSFTIQATVSWSPPLKIKGILSFTVTIICVDGYRVIVTLTVDPTTNTLTFSVVVKSYQLYFAVVTSTSMVGSASANSTEVFSPTGGMLILQYKYISASILGLYILHLIT